MRVSATAKYQRASTRKTRLVTTAIKGKPAMGKKTRRRKDTDKFIIRHRK
jgi:ribosomal protein L22